MKLITTSQGADPRPGLALSETVGIDLPAADPSLPGNWHALLPDLSRVRAVFKNGVLTISLPKSAKSMPRRIEVK